MMTTPLARPLFLACLAACPSSISASAVQDAAQPVQVLDALKVPAPIDRAFPGEMTLDVDATDVAHRIFVVHETIPVNGAAPLTLLYPRWDQGSHGPSQTVTDLAGLTVTANGHPVRWRRNSIEPYAFHLVPPTGTRVLDVTFQMVGGSDLLTPDIVAVPWQRLILYPAGWYARDICVRPSAKLPKGLTHYTALEAAPGGGAAARFVPTSMETMLDSPVLAGRYTSSIPVGPSDAAPVMLDLVALRARDIVVPDQRIAELRRLFDPMQLGREPINRYWVARLGSC